MTGRSLQERIGICRQRFEAAPDSRAFAPLADLLRQAGRHEEALGLLEDGLARHPDFHGAMVILGHTLRDAGRDDHARRVLERVLEHDAENIVARRHLLELARARGDVDAERGHLSRLAADDPGNESWQAALAALPGNVADGDGPPAPESAGGTPDGATGSAGPAAPVRPDDGAFATLTLVDIYLAQGYRARALAALQEILAREPDREDVKRRIAGLGPVDGVEDGPAEAGRGGEPVRRAERAARRAREKEHFSEWIDRIRSDEEGASP